jgi:restriction system protein
MAEVTRHRTGELLRKLFEILIPHPDGLPARDALKELQQRLAADRSVRRSGQQRRSHR